MCIRDRVDGALHAPVGREAVLCDRARLPTVAVAAHRDVLRGKGRENRSARERASTARERMPGEDPPPTRPRPCLGFVLRPASTYTRTP
eukprot:3745179-Pleurochrysis_carterae.AAC.1